MPHKPSKTVRETLEATVHRLIRPRTQISSGRDEDLFVLVEAIREQAFAFIAVQFKCVAPPTSAAGRR
jgi:hypothetical protein